VEEVVTNVQPKEEFKQEIPEAPREDVIPHSCLYELFNVQHNPRNDSALKTIWRWAKEVSVNKDIDSIKMEIIRKRNRMTTSPIGEAPYLRLEMYAKAYFDLKNAEARMEELNGR